MRQVFYAILFTIGIGITMANAQDVPADADPSMPPAQTEEDKNLDDPGSEPEFPVDVVDTTVNDTSEINDISIGDGERMESKDTIRNNWDNSGIPKKEEPED